MKQVCEWEIHSGGEALEKARQGQHSKAPTEAGAILKTA